MQKSVRMPNLRSVFLAKLIFLTALSPAAAEDLVRCETNLGADGQLQSGQFGMIHAPVPFDEVKVVSGPLDIYPELGDATQVLGFGGHLTNSAGPESAVIAFSTTAGSTAHRCEISVEPDFTFARPLSQMQVGNCALEQLGGLKELLPGHIQVWKMPTDFVEAAPSQPMLLDMSVLSSDTIALFGEESGLVTLMWSSENGDGSVQVNICPFIVGPISKESLQPPPDADLCRDIDGQPMRLSVGDSALFALPAPASPSEGNYSYAIGAPEIADVSGHDETSRVPIILAKAKGSTSIAVATNEPDFQAQVCEIVVE